MTGRAKIRLAATIAAPFVVAGVLWAVQPEKCAWMPPCPFHWLTELHCPGCGTARALHKLVHGDILAALRLNVLMTILLPVLFYSLAVDTYYELTGRRVRRVFTSAYASWVLAVLVIGFGIHS